VTPEDTDSIFEEIDENGDGDLQFDEFEQIFNNYDFCDLNNLTAHLIEEFREIVWAHKPNLIEIFNEIDKNKMGYLNITGFTEYIK